MIGTYDILFSDKIILVAEILEKKLLTNINGRELARDIILAINKLEAEKRSTKCQ
jgi:hypothetical protein